MYMCLNGKTISIKGARRGGKKGEGKGGKSQPLSNKLSILSATLTQHLHFFNPYFVLISNSTLTPFHDKTLSKLRIKKNFLNLIKASMKTPQVTTHLTVKDSFTPKIRIMTKLSAFDNSFHCNRGFSQDNQTIKCIQIRKQVFPTWKKLYLLISDMILVTYKYTENPIEFTKKLSE